MVENLCQIGHCLGPQHGDTRLSEVGYSLEDGRSRQMAACVQDAAIFVDALHIDAQHFLHKRRYRISGNIL